VLGTPNRLAISISGPAPRMTADVLERAVPLLRRAAEDLAGELAVQHHGRGGAFVDRTSGRV
jgi:IclR family acetate operon transcriptional repressor